MYITKIRKLTEKRIDVLIETKHPWYKGSQNYFEGIRDEVLEAEAENKENNSVYLEDELGDIFWDYCCLLASLKKEGKITDIDKVFERCYKKLSERIGEDGQGGRNWDEVKRKQKEERKKEHEMMYF